MKPAAAGLKTTVTPGAEVTPLGPGSWRLAIPAGPAGRYRLAQLDDYGSSSRRAFPWRPPVRLAVEARASAPGLPGTWGFGLWNDPFGMAILSGVEVLRLPTLPDTAWFFHAAPPNYLSLDDHLPAQGWLAATFRAPRHPAPLLLLGLPALALLLLPSTRRLLRRLVRRFVGQASVRLDLDSTGWHAYSLEWTVEGVRFWVDGNLALETPAAPRPPLGLVLWIDNQFAALPPDGSFRFGTLPNPEPAWIELRGLEIE